MGRLTKENFEAIARILGEATTKSDIEKELMEYFKRNNPNFDRTRFIQAVRKIRMKRLGVIS